MAKHHLRLHVLGFALAIGITWALGIFILGLGALLLTWGTPLVGTFGSIYIGYEPTLLGSLIGAVWAFIDGFICGAIIALLYNWITCCCCSECKSEEKASE